MNIRLFAALAALLVPAAAWAANFTITIDGESFDIDLDEEKSVVLAGGKKVQLKLTKKAIVRYSAGDFSFHHVGSLSPSRTDLGDGIFQTMLASPQGTLVMVQEYTVLDPSGLVETMLHELTKEEAKYGYKVSKVPATRTLSDGTKLSGKKAISKYRGTEYHRYVLTFAQGDAGVLVVTQIEASSSAEEKAIVDVFWKTLQVSLK